MTSGMAESNLDERFLLAQRVYVDLAPFLQSYAQKYCNCLSKLYLGPDQF